MRVFDSNVVRGVFGPVMDEVPREWRNCTLKRFPQTVN
jgi:hypothetical protein